MSNQEQREAIYVDYWRKVAQDLDLEFELMLGERPEDTIMVIKGPNYASRELLRRAKDQPK